MAGTIQKKKALINELGQQEALIVNLFVENANLEDKLSKRRTIGWTVLVLVLLLVAFTVGGVVATW